MAVEHRWIKVVTALLAPPFRLEGPTSAVGIHKQLTEENLELFLSAASRQSHTCTDFFLTCRTAVCCGSGAAKLSCCRECSLWASVGLKAPAWLQPAHLSDLAPSEAHNSSCSKSLSPRLLPLVGKRICVRFLGHRHVFDWQSDKLTLPIPPTLLPSPEHRGKSQECSLIREPSTLFNILPSAL